MSISTPIPSLSGLSVSRKVVKKKERQKLHYHIIDSGYILKANQSPL